ncbi:hypothetical protein [Kocuria salsicia]|uniref:hypothetical protein n=1 Tax=Kocuria salsicia TaxID=664639 RepID=UPI0021B64D7B|nr:hypothetical protein [Kocuria salsicia]
MAAACGVAVLDALAWALGWERTTALAGRLGAASVAVLVPLAVRTPQDAVVERVLTAAEQRLGERGGCSRGSPSQSRG